MGTASDYIYLQGVPTFLATHADRAHLDVLQEIYASSDGFQDEDGNEHTRSICPAGVVSEVGWRLAMRSLPGGQRLLLTR